MVEAAGALGGGLDPLPDADQRVHAAGQELLNLAQNEMRHLRRVDEVLRLAGRSPSVRRAIRLEVVRTQGSRSPR